MMNFSPLISVVMPCFNCEEYVGRSIASILRQTFEQFEYIIINDGSIDNSDIEIKKYLNDNRIKYIFLKKNVGNYVARNIGMKMATGKYICVMDADDISNRDRLSLQYKYLEKNRNIGCLGSQGFWIDSNDNIISDLNKPTNADRLRVFLLKDNFTLHPSLMFLRKVIIQNNLFYNERFRYAADYDFVVRFSSLSKIINVEDRLLHYRVHDNQISKLKYKFQVDTVRQVRIEQLRNMGIIVSIKEASLYNRLLEGCKLSTKEFKLIVEFLNIILENNRALKRFNQNILFNFFERELINAQIRFIP